MLTGILDGPLSGGLPKLLELHALCDLNDLTDYGLGKVVNGRDASSGQMFTFPFVGDVQAGSFLYVGYAGSSGSRLDEWFGNATSPTLLATTTAVNVDGNDAIELYQLGHIVDQFGASGVGTSLQPWHYTNGWAYRVAGATPSANGTFISSQFHYSGVNALSACTSNAACAAPFPIASYSPSSPRPPSPPPPSPAPAPSPPPPSLPPPSPCTTPPSSPPLPHLASPSPLSPPATSALTPSSPSPLLPSSPSPSPLPSPPSPLSLPPSPLPLSPGSEYRPVVRADFTLAGDVSSFDRDAFATALAVEMGLEAGNVRLTIFSASVRVLALIVMQSAAAAQAATTTLSATSAAALSSALGVTVQAITATADVVALDAPSPPPASPVAATDGGEDGAPLIAAIASGIGVLVICTAFAVLCTGLRQTRKSCFSTAEVKKDGVQATII